MHAVKPRCKQRCGCTQTSGSTKPQTSFLDARGSANEAKNVPFCNCRKTETASKWLVMAAFSSQLWLGCYIKPGICWSPELFVYTKTLGCCCCFLLSINLHSRQVLKGEITDSNQLFSFSSRWCPLGTQATTIYRFSDESKQRHVMHLLCHFLG